MFVDPVEADMQNNGQYDHHIFFDDNIERHRMHIVVSRRLMCSTGRNTRSFLRKLIQICPMFIPKDARIRGTNTPLSFQDCINVFAVRVLPMKAITDELYFITALARCERV